jgi:hypothetical protein
MSQKSLTDKYGSTFGQKKAAPGGEKLLSYLENYRNMIMQMASIEKEVEKQGKTLDLSGGSSANKSNSKAERVMR